MTAEQGKSGAEAQPSRTEPKTSAPPSGDVYTAPGKSRGEAAPTRRTEPKTGAPSETSKGTTDKTTTRGRGTKATSPGRRGSTPPQEDTTDKKKPDVALTTGRGDRNDIQWYRDPRTGILKPIQNQRPVDRPGHGGKPRKRT